MFLLTEPWSALSGSPVDGRPANTHCIWIIKQTELLCLLVQMVRTRKSGR